MKWDKITLHVNRLCYSLICFSAVFMSINSKTVFCSIIIFEVIMSKDLHFGSLCTF